MGGAVARVGDDATAFTSRRAGHAFNITGITAGPEDFEEERDWARTRAPNASATPMARRSTTGSER